MGWKTASTVLGGDTLPAGVSTTLAIPSQQQKMGAAGAGSLSASQTFVAIIADWMPPNQTQQTIFLSYHRSSANDVGTPGFSDGLLMHAYQGTVQVRES